MFYTLLCQNPSLATYLGSLFQFLFLVEITAFTMGVSLVLYLLIGDLTNFITRKVEGLLIHVGMFISRNFLLCRCLIVLFLCLFNYLAFCPAAFAVTEQDCIDVQAEGQGIMSRTTEQLADANKRLREATIAIGSAKEDQLWLENNLGAAHESTISASQHVQNAVANLHSLYSDQATLVKLATLISYESFKAQRLVHKAFFKTVILQPGAADTLDVGACLNATRDGREDFRGTLDMFDAELEDLLNHTRDCSCLRMTASWGSAMEL